MKEKKNVYPNITQLKLRRLTPFDVEEFRRAFLESKDSIKTFLDLGFEFDGLNIFEFQSQYLRMISETNIEHFGVFHGYKMLAYACYCEGYSPAGKQIVYWVREKYLQQNIGTWTIGRMTSKSWVERDEHYTQLIIDKGNYASRRIAKKLNYFPLYAVSTLNAQGTKKTGTYICYIHLNPSLNMKAAAWNRRALDLVGHPCMMTDLHHLIYDEAVSRYFTWPEPLYVEDDIDEEGRFINWKPDLDINDPSNELFDDIEKYF
jgi:RimJ/RimL family protein N-acetyltransferase